MRARNLRRAQREVWKLAGRNPAECERELTDQTKVERFTDTQDNLLKALGVILLLIWGLLVGILFMLWWQGLLGL